VRVFRPAKPLDGGPLVAGTAGALNSSSSRPATASAIEGCRPAREAPPGRTPVAGEDSALMGYARDMATYTFNLASRITAADVRERVLVVAIEEFDDGGKVPAETVVEITSSFSKTMG
jgi:hypothetical protein